MDEWFLCVRRLCHRGSPKAFRAQKKKRKKIKIERKKNRKEGKSEERERRMDRGEIIDWPFSRSRVSLSLSPILSVFSLHPVTPLHSRSPRRSPGGKNGGKSRKEEIGKRGRNVDGNRSRGALWDEPQSWSASEYFVVVDGNKKKKSRKRGGDGIGKCESLVSRSRSLLLHAWKSFSLGAIFAPRDSFGETQVRDRDVIVDIGNIRDNCRRSYRSFAIEFFLSWTSLNRFFMDEAPLNKTGI